MPSNPSVKQSSASRANGQRGGRPRKDRAPDAAKLSTLRAGRLTAEADSNLLFLVDVRDGMVLGATVADRIRAVEAMLDRTPGYEKGQKVEHGGAAAQPTTKVVVLDERTWADKAPAGWRSEPIREGENPGLKEN